MTTLLVDELEKREEEVRVLPTHKDYEFVYAEGWCLVSNETEIPFSADAWNTLMNKLRIPIKYIERLVLTIEGQDLAEQCVEHAARGNEFLFLENADGVITQVFSESHLFLPGIKVNDYIFDIFESDLTVHSYNIDGDIFEAVYLTDKVRTVDDTEYRIGVRVLYSDCFTITPRFDGVVCDLETGAIISHPTVGRKFRVADTSIDQIYEQIAQFTELSVDGALNNLVPALSETPHSRESQYFIENLCIELRYSKKVLAELREYTDFLSDDVISLAKALSAYVENNDFETITVGMKRDISVALGNYLMHKRFK